MRVLYVDDDPAMCAAVEQMLDSEGYECESVGLGKQAVGLAKRNKYDIILLDIMLPDIDGYEVVERLRKGGVRTPILVQSGLVDRENDMDGLWLGTNEYLVKPFNKDELVGRIRAVLSRATNASVPDPVYAPDAAAAAQEGEAQRRRHRRFDTMQSGRIHHGGGIDCVILDMSYGGAMIQLPAADIDCPQVFELELQSGSTHRCQVRWRSGDRIGVRRETEWPEEVAVEPAAESEAGAPVEDERETMLVLPQARPASVRPPEAPLADQSAPPVRTAPQPEEDSAEGPRVFTVDRGIRLVAEACECTDLVVEGYFEAVARARRLRVGPEGRFVGTAEVAVAEIHGQVEGDLTVTEKLVIHPTGTTAGTTRYRQIVIESGGRILGEARILSPGSIEVSAGPRDLRRRAPAA
jgi:DNA-binding response OmpR family regulator/cytoskeletal protein CcmA (bactofilin family)